MNNKNKTPLKSIRKYCLWCSNNSFKEISLCPSNDCPLYDFRSGKKVKKGSLIKLIRLKCLDCTAGDKKMVRECKDTSCPLFRYRMGTSPAHKQLWNGRRPACCLKKGSCPAITKKTKQGV